MGMGGRPGRPRPARDAHQPLLVRRNYLLRPRGIAFPDEVMRSRVWPTLGLGYYVSQPFDPVAVSSHNPNTLILYLHPSFHSLHSILLSIYHFTPPLILRVIRFTRVTYLCHYLRVYHYLPYSSHLYPSSLPSLTGGYTCHYFGYCLNQSFNPIILFYILGLMGFRVCPYSVTLSLFGHASDACPY